MSVVEWRTRRPANVFVQDLCARLRQDFVFGSPNAYDDAYRALHTIEYLGALDEPYIRAVWDIVAQLQMHPVWEDTGMGTEGRGRWFEEILASLGLFGIKITRKRTRRRPTDDDDEPDAMRQAR